MVIIPKQRIEEVKLFCYQKKNIFPDTRDTKGDEYKRILDSYIEKCVIRNVQVNLWLNVLLEYERTPSNMLANNTMYDTFISIMIEHFPVRFSFTPFTSCHQRLHPGYWIRTPVTVETPVPVDYSVPVIFHESTDGPVPRGVYSFTHIKEEDSVAAKLEYGKLFHLQEEEISVES